MLIREQNRSILVKSLQEYFLQLLTFHPLKEFCTHPHASTFQRLSPFNNYVLLHSKINSSAIINCKFIAFCQGGESVTSHKR